MAVCEKGPAAVNRPTLEDRVLDLEVRLDRIIDSINHNVKSARMLHSDVQKKLSDLQAEIKAIKKQKGNPFGTI